MIEFLKGNTHNRYSVITFYYWDIKSIMITILIMIGIVGFFGVMFYYPQIVQSIKLMSHEQSVNGKLISVTPQSNLTQSELGNKLETHHFLVSFSYEVDGKSYIGNELILSAGNVKYQLYKILESKDKKVEIRYAKEDASKSILVLE